MGALHGYELDGWMALVLSLHVCSCKMGLTLERVKSRLDFYYNLRYAVGSKMCSVE